MIVRITPRAEADIRRLNAWLSFRAPLAAEKALAEIRDALELLAEYPYAAPAVGTTLRRKVVGFGRDGYIVLYRVTANEVVVMRVKQGREDA